MPTHVAGLPVAVNVSCHVTRRASAEPVSYTHLDVYKRQIFYFFGTALSYRGTVDSVSIVVVVSIALCLSLIHI